MSDLLDKYEQESGNAVPIHGGILCHVEYYITKHHSVDAASGGFVAPFATVSFVCTLQQKII